MVMIRRHLLCLLALAALSTVAVAQTCPSGVPRVAPDSRYSIDSTNEVVTDRATGLMWKRCSEGQSGAACATVGSTFYTWTTALTQANTSTHAGFDDWRLPNAEELYSLVETGCSNPSINTTAFPATVLTSYWSSTTYAPDVSIAWVVFFTVGNLNATLKSNNRRVRLVRGGQSFDAFASELDAVPDAFTLTPQIPVPRASVRTSDPLTVAGLTTVTGISVSGAPGSSYSINSTEFYTTQPGAVRNGDVVRVRHTSTEAYASPTTTVLSIGGVTGEFVSHTEHAIGLNDSAQIECYNGVVSTGTVSTGTPDPEAAGFDEQDCTRGAAAADALGRMVKVGESTAPGRDYTKIANDGSVLPATATLGTGPADWGCTRDNITGLIWEVKVNDVANLRHLDHTYFWYDTNPAINGGTAGTIGTSVTCSGLTNCNTTAYRDAINALTGPARLCGATDWRLPTSNELSELVHLGLAAGPVIDGTWFPNTANTLYWTGETYAPTVANAWSVNFGNGGFGLTNKSNGLRVRLVRGGQ
jgi:hypothetical protein